MEKLLTPPVLRTRMDPGGSCHLHPFFNQSAHPEYGIFAVVRPEFVKPTALEWTGLIQDLSKSRSGGEGEFDSCHTKGSHDPPPGAKACNLAAPLFLFETTLSFQ